MLCNFDDDASIPFAAPFDNPRVEDGRTISALWVGMLQHNERSGRTHERKFAYYRSARLFFASRRMMPSITIF